MAGFARVSQITRGGLLGATPRGQPWTSAVTLPPGRNGLIAWRMAVLSPLREPSLYRHVHRALLRSVVLDLIPIIAATACHQRNYVETYSRYTCHMKYPLCEIDPDYANMLLHEPCLLLCGMIAAEPVIILAYGSHSAKAGPLH